MSSRVKVRVRPERGIRQDPGSTNKLYSVRAWQGEDCLDSQKVFGLRDAMKFAVSMASRFGPGVPISRPKALLPHDINELATGV